MITGTAAPGRPLRCQALEVETRVSIMYFPGESTRHSALVWASRNGCPRFGGVDTLEENIVLSWTQMGVYFQPAEVPRVNSG